MRPYRAIQYLSVLFLLAGMILVGCESASTPDMADSSGERPSESSTLDWATAATGEGADCDSIGGDGRLMMSRSTSVAGSTMTAEDIYTGGETAESSIQPGTLTAGCFDDTAEPEAYTNFIAGLSDAQGPIADLAGKFADEPLILLVTDMHDTPLPNVRITLPKGEADAVRTLVTGTDGRVVLFDGWDDLTARGEPLTDYSDSALDPYLLQLSMEFTVDGQSVDRDVLGISSDSALDLVFVVDCTGSMGDELEYLKVELKSIVEHIATQFPEVDQRYALVVYRDDGDQYVTRTFDFTESLQAFRDELGKQASDGGGDYPEAVDKALADATELSWSDQGVRMLFHVADAPPHDDKAALALDATQTLRERGVAIYPVASSGVADTAEFIMRTEAMLTGGQYVFLTDDSGVGNAHAEPHFPHYAVQTLKDVMIRMIASELAGETVEPNPDRIIRTVAPQTAGDDEAQ
jgi:hypothetical protein